MKTASIRGKNKVTCVRNKNSALATLVSFTHKYIKYTKVQHRILKTKYIIVINLKGDFSTKLEKNRRGEKYNR